MQPGNAASFVLFDLSTLEPAAAHALLSDLASKPVGRAHWILAAAKVKAVLGGESPGARFLRDRLAAGDRLLCPNPTGLDWNTLFPSEAASELQALAELAGPEALPFLNETPVAPPWLGGTALRASPEGLWVHNGQVSLVAWASGGAGAWWVVPGQALVATLPALPWGDLLAVSNPSRSAVEPLPPVAKKPFHVVGVLRRAENPTPLRHAVLFRSADFPGLMDKDAVDSEETLGGIRRRQLVASMQGQTVLREGELTVRFQGGRLTRVDHGGRELSSGAATYLEWSGKRHIFSVVSAFSFEGDFSWGLRQNLVLTHEDLSEPGRAIVDIYFVEESRELFAAVTVRWPRWKTPATVASWAPFELTLFAASAFSSRSLWPTGEGADQVHRGERLGVLCGTDFVFADKTSVAVGFPQNQTPRPYRLPWKLEKGRLVVNPEGGYTPKPSSEFEGIEEHFTLYFTPAEGAKLPFSPTRKQATELIPPYVIDVHQHERSEV